MAKILLTGENMGLKLKTKIHNRNIKDRKETD